MKQPQHFAAGIQAAGSETHRMQSPCLKLKFAKFGLQIKDLKQIQIRDLSAEIIPSVIEVRQSRLYDEHLLLNVKRHENQFTC